MHRNHTLRGVRLDAFALRTLNDEVEERHDGLGVRLHIGSGDASQFRLAMAPRYLRSE